MPHEEGHIDPLTLLTPRGPGEVKGQQAIDEATRELSVPDMATFTPPGMPQPSDADFKAFNLLNKISPQEAGSAVGDIGRTGFFPGIDDPILKGVSGSQTLGSQPIFVGSGGFFPFEIIESRKRRMQAAAQARAEQLRTFDPGMAPAVKDKRFQGKLFDEFRVGLDRFMAEANQTFGDKGFLALQSKATEIGRRKARWIEDMNLLADQTDQITDFIAKTETDIQKGEIVVSPETNKLLEQFKSGEGQFSGFDPRNLRVSLNELSGSVALDDFLTKNNVISGISERIENVLVNITSRGEYDLVRTRETIDAKEQIELFAEQAKGRGGAFEFNDNVSAELIKDRLNASLLSSIKDKFQFKSTPQKFKEEVKPEDVNTQATGKFKFGNTVISGTNVVEASEKAKFTNIIGAQIFDAESGNQLKERNQEFKLVKFVELWSTPDIQLAEQITPLLGRLQLGEEEMFTTPGGETLISEETFTFLRQNHPEFAEKIIRMKVAIGTAKSQITEVVEGKSKVVELPDRTVFMKVDPVRAALKDAYPTELEIFEKGSGGQQQPTRGTDKLSHLK